MATHDCSPNADCSNVMGSFHCNCKSGYSGDGKTCQGTCGPVYQVLQNVAFIKQILQISITHCTYVI